MRILFLARVFLEWIITFALSFLFCRDVVMETHTSLV